MQHLRYVRSQNTDHNHKLVKIDLSGNAISLNGSRDIDLQLNMNIRFNAEKKALKNKQKIASGKVDRLKYRNTVKKQDRLVDDLKAEDDEYKQLQTFSEEKERKYERQIKQD